MVSPRAGRFLPHALHTVAPGGTEASHAGHCVAMLSIVGGLKHIIAFLSFYIPVSPTASGTQSEAMTKDATVGAIPTFAMSPKV